MQKRIHALLLQCSFRCCCSRLFCRLSLSGGCMRLCFSCNSGWICAWLPSWFRASPSVAVRTFVGFTHARRHATTCSAANRVSTDQPHFISYHFKSAPALQYLQNTIYSAAPAIATAGLLLRRSTRRPLRMQPTGCTIRATRIANREM